MSDETDTLVVLATQITPGPWREGARFSAIVADHPTGHDDDRSVNAYGGHLVCESVKDFANASLLALAPDLLAETIANRARIEALEAEVARVTRHADAGWDQQRYWSGRYEESAKIRDAMDAQLTEALAGEDELAAALRELHAMVVGECGRLLDDTRGGSGQLDVEIDDALASHAKRKEGR